MGLVDGFYYGRAKIVTYSSAAADEGKIVKVTSTSTSSVWTGTFGEGLTLTFEVPMKDKYKIEVYDSTGVTVEYTTYQKAEYGGYYEVEVGLNTTTWTGIQRILDAGEELNLLNIGDEHTAVLTTGEEVIYQIAAINLYETHEVIFAPKYCLETAGKMNSSNTNAGGWTNCEMRTWLNETFFSELPEELQGLIADWETGVSSGSQASTIQYATDKIKLPREYEFFGATTYAATTEYSTAGAQQWPLFATAANRTKTYGASGAACDVWESSPYVSNSSGFCYVAAAGAASGSVASNALGVLPCFHFVASAT